MNSLPLLCVCVAFAVLATTKTHASEMIELSLDSLEPFQAQAGNWTIVGSVSMNPDIDIHDTESPSINHNAVSSITGTGILLNENDESRSDHLLTVMEHGDIEIDLELMLPKGSNSGIYLQGRYEIQLFDSWGVDSPTYSDIGGIYRNWETDPSKTFRGIPPLVNAAKAPGLWQRLHLIFRAPKFDSDGEKTSNARFDYVDLNGIRIHENVHVPHLTGGPIGNFEAQLGPIMIQGDHGPIAIRNFRYKLLKDAPVQLSELAYKTHHGSFNKVLDFENLPSDASDSIELIDVNAAGVPNDYAISFTSELIVNEPDTYTLQLIHTGGVLFSIDGDPLVDLQHPDAQGNHTVSKFLSKGSHQLVLHNYKTQAWSQPQLAISIKGSNTHQLDLHAVSSYGAYRGIPSPIYLDTESKARLHRGFFNATDRLYSHTIAVGDPSGLHYVYDIESATIVVGWRGPFIDTTPMWHDRGNGTFRTRGAAEPISSQSLFHPVHIKETENSGFIQKGYSLDKSSGRPTFHYKYHENKYSVSLTPDTEGKRLICRIANDDSSSSKPILLRIAQGSEIEKISETRFIVGDHRYYIDLEDGTDSNVKDSDTLSELIVPLSNKPITFSLTW